MNSRRKQNALVLGPLSLVVLSACVDRVPQTARRARTVYVLEEASGVLATQRDRTGQYPNPTRHISALGPIIANLDTRFRDSDHQIDGWGNQPFYWSNGVNVALISAGRDGEPDMDYEAVLMSTHLEPLADFCSQLGAGCKDDMVLLDGRRCVDFPEPHGASTRK